jgi:hypothetical protein
MPVSTKSYMVIHIGMPEKGDGEVKFPNAKKIWTAVIDGVGVFITA